MNNSLTSLPTRAAQASLSQNEVARYSRHLIMPEVGVDGQKRLKAASVLLVGAGGHRSPLGLHPPPAGGRPRRRGGIPGGWTPNPQPQVAPAQGGRGQPDAPAAPHARL